MMEKYIKFIFKRIKFILLILTTSYQQLYHIRERKWSKTIYHSKVFPCVSSTFCNKDISFLFRLKTKQSGNLSQKFLSIYLFYPFRSSVNFKGKPPFHILTESSTRIRSRPFSFIQMQIIALAAAFSNQNRVVTGFSE